MDRRAFLGLLTNGLLAAPLAGVASYAKWNLREGL
jgi:hypothetical protein